MPSKIRALVVDDDPDFRFFIGFVLDTRGVEFETAPDAATALELYQAHRQDLILVDKTLPDHSGLQLVQEIRAVPAEQSPLIVLITGTGSEDTLEEALDAGVDDYIAKPLDPGALNVRLAIAERRILDARARRAREAELAPNAMVDSLTGLATRALLRDRVEGGIHRSRRGKDYLFGLLRLDLDAFRRLNESQGKEVGDQILVEVANRIQSAIRSLDTAARIAADEFGVFLDDLKELSDVTRVTSRIREAFAEPIQVGDKSFFVGASIGVTLYTPEYSDAEEMLRDSSRALRQAKAEGSGSVRVFNPDQQREISVRAELEEAIRTALDRGEMVLHYQPIFSLREGSIFGLEALIRWPRPDGSFVPAEEFIPVAERSGLINHLGWWTMEEAARQVQEWHAQLPGVPPVVVMVNIPGKLFSEPELVPTAVRILEKTGLSPEYLHLEITETSAMSDLEQSLKTLQALKEVGVHIHVDDFGTGYSSLSYLHRFPVDSLKVDRSFVSRMTEGPEQLAIVRTVVDLAKSLGLSVVAEGVETPEELVLIRGMGCDYIQGWLFAKAMEPSEASRIIENPRSVLGDYLS